ncbi:chorismate mutase [Croceicoccus sp. F390]|uniref:chorismate mutase n=1 Tax=Croceicoccus esteveae TaxID=3075597 RepID=A0ABU2ZER7_9SPHN|nr:chorismate mutase [Croceicoccus sp. F390]MDT0575096.1 chorismate mutase [Croceicoccus sp. F390]
MNDPIIAADDCTTMAEVRAGVDELDRQLVDLLARRFGYMRAAARIKPTRDSVRDEDRKQQVITAATMAAQRSDMPAGFVARIWDDVVETSIAYELDHWDALRSA